MKLPRWRLFPKYATLIIAVVAGVLVVSGAISLCSRGARSRRIWWRCRSKRRRARRRASSSTCSTSSTSWAGRRFRASTRRGDALEQRRIEYLKLLRQAPAITELVWIGTDGRERLRVSRLAMDVVGAGADLSQEPAFTAARARQDLVRAGASSARAPSPTWRSRGRPAATAASRWPRSTSSSCGTWCRASRSAQKGLAYVVDATGTLIAHPDISLVLKKTDLKALPQVAAALDGAGADAVDRRARPGGPGGVRRHARIPALDWTVFVESPRAEAFAPLHASIMRTGAAAGRRPGAGGRWPASSWRARWCGRSARCRRAPRASAPASSTSASRCTRATSSKAWPSSSTRWARELQESYAGLERKVEERTRELSDALEQQTATAEILRVISGSLTDVQPVFEKILQSCRRLFASARPRQHRAAWRRRPLQCRSLPRAATRRCSSVPDASRADTPAGTELAIRERRSLHVADVLARTRHARLHAHVCQRTAARTTMVMAPMLWKDQGDRRRSSRSRGRAEPFTDKEDRAAEDLRRPGGDRDPERAPVQRNQGGAGAADRHRRGAAGDQRLSGRHAAGFRARSCTAARALFDADAGRSISSATTALLHAGAPAAASEDDAHGRGETYVHRPRENIVGQLGHPRPSWPSANDACISPMS